MRLQTLVPGWVLLGAVACSAPLKPAAAPAPDLKPRLDAADQLVRIGCFDCLTEALREYEALRAVSAAPAAIVASATAGAVRAAALLDIRERELGMTDDGYLQRARDLAATSEELRTRSAAAFEIVENIPWHVMQYPTTAAGVPTPAAFRELQAKRQQQTEALKARADTDELASYSWLAFGCANPLSRADGAALLSALTVFRDAPLVVYRAATCVRADKQKLTDLVEREPRFVEIAFHLGSIAIGARELDDAEAHMKRAYDWHPRWPAVTTSLGNLYMSAEEVATALTFYDRTLELAPEHGEALIGRVRALSHLGRHDDAFATIDHVLKETRWFPGETLYWRAWNELQVGRIEEAWASVGRAEALWAGGQVSKLAGLIALRRKELEVGRGKFELGRRQTPEDCEMSFLLGSTHAELRSWEPTAAVFVETAACVKSAQNELTRTIARIQASKASEERKARLVARAEQKIRDAERMLATSWFNTAAAYYNLAKKAEAREYAEKVSADPQFGERARDLLSRLEK